MVTGSPRVRVLELSGGLAGAYAGWLLASLGAEVTLAAAPSGGYEAERLARESLAQGKTIRADATLAALIPESDVVFCDDPQLLRGIADDPAALADRFPGVIFGFATPLGLRGPYADGPATSLDAQALASVSWALGEPDRAPLSLPPGVLEHQSGCFLASASLVALRHRAATGEGNVIDVALSDVLASYVAGNCRFFIHHGMEWRRSGNRATSSGGAYPFVVLPCADGAVCISGRTREEWNRLMKVMGDPDWASEPRYQNLRAMGREYPEEVDALIKPWFARHSMAELERLALENQLIVAPVRALADVLATPQFNADGFLKEVSVDGHRLKVPALPFRITPTRSADAPDRAATMLTPLPSSTLESVRDRPLAGIRVIDFGWVWSAPWVGTMLGELGAEVIKVEHGRKLDNLRLSGKVWRNGAIVEGPSTEMSPMYHQVNHGKLGITLNTKDPRAVDILLDLAASSDLVVENMSPGSMERTGLGYETLRTRNPKLVMLAMSAAGQFGPLANMRAYAPTMSSFAGLEALVGYPGGTPMGALNFALGDPDASAHGLLAALAALHRAQATGEGSYVDLSQIAALAGTLRPLLIQAQIEGRQPLLAGNRHPAQAPHGIFPASGTDRWLTLAVADDAQWRALAELVPHEPWASDPRFATTPGRLANVEALEAAIGRWTTAQDRDALVARLRSAGLASAPVLSIEEMWRHPHFQARQIHSLVDIPVYGPEAVFRAPWQFSRFAPVVERPGPSMGQHNRPVLSGIVGIPDDEIDQLVEAGVVS